MALVISGLLMLIQLQILFVVGSVTQSKICGTNCITYLKSLDLELFNINGETMDKPSFCKFLQYYYTNGCFLDSSFEDWELRRFGCDFELFSVKLPLREGRKLLRDSNGSREEKNGFSSNLKPKTMAMAAPAMLLFCCTLLWPCCRSRRKNAEHAVLAKDPNSMDSVSSLEVNSVSEMIPRSPLRVPPSPLRVPPSPSRFSNSPKLSRLGSVHLNMSQIIKATHNFSPSLQIGEGGFGTVYRGQLQNGQVVAFKRAKKEYFETLRTEFSNEVELLAKIDHRNLVKLLGYVDKGNELIIITEFIPNGTLREHLDGLHGKVLDFYQRLEISIDVAHALTYLHLYTEKQIIHRDVKSSNILLTESLRAKVADFGFARIGSADSDQTHISTKVKGTAGYLDPEYLKTYQLTPKSDVYSFGIMLVEILTGRRPLELNKAADERVTVRWAFKKCNEGKAMEALDPLMEKVVDADMVTKMFDLAFLCAAPVRPDRPNMKEVAEQLWAIRMDHLKSVRREIE